MLVFSEGVPRSGKSYDAVKNHILPALKKGRYVYARLNGLNHERIAAHLGEPVERINELLHHVPTNVVAETFAALQDHSDGQWVIDDKFRNALIVIDEVHEFYIGGTREALPASSEQFFALHGHYGMDILVMTQFYKRVHTALRYRIERKNVFQKLSALGKKGEGLYRETAYQTVAPDKYEKVGARTCTYDDAVFPLYHGIVGGGDSGVQQAVYEGGRTTVWRGMLVRAAIIVPLGLFAVWYLLDFFSGGGTALVKEAGATTSAYQAKPSDQGEAMPGYVAAPKPAAPVVAGPPVPPPPPPDPLEDFTAEQRYVWDLAEKGRARLAALIGEGDSARGLVEWVTGSQEVADRLTLAQLRDLGIDVSVHPYGVKLQVQEQVAIVTAWPLNIPVRDAVPMLYDTSQGQGGAAGRVSDSEPLPTAPLGIGDASAEGQQADYGAFRS